MKKVELTLSYAGFCYAKEKYSIKGGGNFLIKFQALFGVIFHSNMGWILYDTGYTTRFYDVTKNYPNKIYANATKVEVTETHEVKSQLKKMGLSPSDIKHIVITHFHADHIGGLKDFQEATFYCSKKAFNHLESMSQFWGFTKGILKDLIPSDFTTRLKFIEEFSTKIPDEIFGHKYDLWGDDSMFIYELPGHAAGQIGVLLKTEKNTYFLIADACWNRKSYTELILPPQIVRIFIDSWKGFKYSLGKINAFHNKYPEVIIVPTHCSATTDSIVNCVL